MRSGLDRSLTRTATGGALWLGSSLGAQVAIGLAAQIVLAAILTPHDFGLFALVISVSYVLSSFANFGIRTLMAQRSPMEISRLRPAVLRAGVMAAASAAIVLVAVSPVVSRLLDEPDLRGLMLVAAISLLLRPFIELGIATLQARLEFAKIAVALLIATTAHYAVAIALARTGAGALSLVVGLQVNATVMMVLMWWHTRRREMSGEVTGVREAARLARWPLAGEVAMDARLDYLVIRLFAGTEVVGYYHFAFMLVYRLIDLLVGVSRSVLFPTLARIGSSVDRQSFGVHRAAVVLVAAGGIAAAGLVAAMTHAEDILWSGRWAAAVPAVMLLASAAPVQAAAAAVEQLLKARGLFRRWAAVMAARSVGSAVVVLIVGVAVGADATATVIAAAVAGFLVVEAVAEVFVLGPGLGIAPARFWKSVLPWWGVLVGAGWAVAAGNGWGLGAWAATAAALGTVLAVAAVVGLVMRRRGLLDVR